MKTALRLTAVWALMLAFLAAPARAQDEEMKKDARETEQQSAKADAELAKWIDTLVAHLKSDNEKIAESAGAALAAVGAPAKAKVAALAAKAEGAEKRRLDGIVRRIDRAEAQAKAEEARKPENLAKTWGAKLKLDEKKTKNLEKVLTRNAARMQELQEQMRDGEVDRRELMQEMRAAREDLGADLQDFMSEEDARTLMREMGGMGGGRGGMGGGRRGGRGNRGGGGGQDL